MPKKYLFFGKSAISSKEIIFPKEAFKEAYSYLRAIVLINMVRVQLLFPETRQLQQQSNVKPTR